MATVIVNKEKKQVTITMSYDGYIKAFEGKNKKMKYITDQVGSAFGGAPVDGLSKFSLSCALIYTPDASEISATHDRKPLPVA